MNNSFHDYIYDCMEGMHRRGMRIGSGWWFSFFLSPKHHFLFNVSTRAGEKKSERWCQSPFLAFGRASDRPTQKSTYPAIVPRTLANAKFLVQTDEACFTSSSNEKADVQTQPCTHGRIRTNIVSRFIIVVVPTTQRIPRKQQTIKDKSSKF